MAAIYDIESEFTNIYLPWKSPRFVNKVIDHGYRLGTSRSPKESCRKIQGTLTDSPQIITDSTTR
ncbi:hypothetical protein BPOR_0024g00060 [Botrytis porri]|uniref:Uncharacterized protein n=1 Tax=Botrytis porri TaxID=87229 RepID=A0A4Z1L407_9HELO|nr:hypothetical protein BPOR_0024g00060 [Botrytis porri]